MFTLKKNPTLKTAIHIEVPGDMGEVTTTSFTADFKVRDYDDVIDIEKQRREGELTNVDLLLDNLVHVDDLLDEAGEPLVFNEALVRELCNYPYITTGLINGFFDVQLGKTKAKN